MPRAISGSSVVITGASSGIGYCAALGFARRGARLTLAARQPNDLEALTHECRRLGAEARAVPTDVADGGAVENLALEAEDAFGRIDTWINGAGVMAYGTFEQVPAEVFERVIDTNLTGHINGARAALRRFRAQRAGVLVNLSSVWGRVTTPLVTPYVVSKHAIRAFSECLRHELVDEPAIYVVTVLPQAVDTPIFEHSANHSGRRLRPVPPLFDPQSVADGIVACAESPKREITYGRTGRILEILYALSPRVYCRLAPATFMRGTFAADPTPHTSGNVLTPSGGRARGGWRTERVGDLARATAAAAYGAMLGLVGRPDKAKPTFSGSDRGQSSLETTRRRRR
jgi:short-subunit dehydrogenase